MPGGQSQWGMSERLDYEHSQSLYAFLDFPMQWPVLFKQSVRLLVGICLMVSLWLSWVPIAVAITVQDVPNPRQTSGGWVTDMAALLSPDAEAQINQIATDLEADTQAELAVVTVPTTDPAASPKAFATELFNTWGIGKAAQDNGLLILVSRDERRVEIETGRGTAKILPDAQVASLIETVIVPRFRREDYAGGIIQITQQLADEIRHNADRLRQFVIPPVIWQLLGVSTLGLLGILGGLTWRSRQPTPLKMGERQTRRDVLREEDFETWVGEHPEYKFTGLFLAPTVIAIAVVLYSLTFMVLTATRYWGGAIFSFSLLIPILAALLIFGELLKFLVDWLINNRRFQVVLWEVIQPEWDEVVSFFLVSVVVVFILAGFASVLGWFPLRDFGWWIQRPMQAAGLMAGCSVLLSGKLLQKFERDSLSYRIQHQAFCCDRNHTAINLLQPEQLKPLLTSKQKKSLAAKAVKICGWHCPTCNAAINRESTHLQIAQIYRPLPSSGSKRSGRSRTSSDSGSASSTYEPNYYPDTSSSSGSSDFGGGGSDGGGAGSDW
ncbi:TPM domain-containing protein [Leptothoe sp. PORK10 BA2]|uniref:TPM domain-containing protein n=1 Tax=Leptothoe sp. PORK10 BA2 TaxID=3110254 RepID=UPI002B1F813C|nr:TPM domain-containing protein [Leptothoe sp. PORK10 BA2]MEA5463801.1 TPM domain-containing protein [Leptothoe sp. PORK10 BA2]